MIRPGVAQTPASHSRKCRRENQPWKSSYRATCNRGPCLGRFPRMGQTKRFERTYKPAEDEEQGHGDITTLNEEAENGQRPQNGADPGAAKGEEDMRGDDEAGCNATEALEGLVFGVMRGNKRLPILRLSLKGMMTLLDSFAWERRFAGACPK